MTPIAYLEGETPRILLEEQREVAQNVVYRDGRDPEVVLSVNTQCYPGGHLLRIGSSVRYLGSIKSRPIFSCSRHYSDLPTGEQLKQGVILSGMGKHGPEKILISRVAFPEIASRQFGPKDEAAMQGLLGWFVRFIEGPNEPLVVKRDRYLSESRYRSMFSKTPEGLFELEGGQSMGLQRECTGYRVIDKHIDLNSPLRLPTRTILRPVEIHAHQLVRVNFYNKGGLALSYEGSGFGWYLSIARAINRSEDINQIVGWLDSDVHQVRPDDLV